MQAIKCELCGSNDIMKQEGFFQCQNCGTLDLFLERGAISKAQYDISLKELTDKLQIDKLTE